MGPDHPETLAARGNLAYAYRSAGRLKDALPVYRRTLAGRERAQGPDHPDTITARGNLADACFLAGRYKEAVPLYERTLAGQERAQGPGPSRHHHRARQPRLGLPLGAQARPGHSRCTSRT